MPDDTPKSTASLEVGETVPMPIPNMETCVFGIKVLKHNASRHLAKIKAMVAPGTLAETELLPHERHYSSMIGQFNDWHQKFVTAVEALKECSKHYAANIEVFEETEDILDEYEKLIFQVRKAFEAVIPTAAPQGAASVVNLTKPRFKQEPVKIPVFTGDPSQWETFHDLFTTVIEADPIYSNAEKLTILQYKLSGKALSVISSFKIKDENYEPAWDLIKRRFSNQREIAFSHLKKLYEMKRAEDTAQDLNAMVDLVNEVYRSLEFQGVQVQHWDVILVFWIVKKIDDVTRTEWLLTQGKELPVLQELLDFLENRAAALDDSMSRAKKPKEHPELKRPASSVRFVHSATATAGPTESKRPRGECICCSQPFHPFSACAKFLALNPAARRDLTRRAGMCDNCFKKKHQAKDCENKFKCRIFNQPHHTLLHDAFHHNAAATAPPTAGGAMQPNVSSAPAENPNPPQSSGSATAHQPFPPQRSSGSATAQPAPPQCSLGSATSNHVLLSTMRVNILDRNRQIQTARVFIDNGSQVEFISTDLVRRLGLKRFGNPIDVNGLGGLPGPSTLGKVKLTLQSKLNSFQLPIEAEVIEKLTATALPQIETEATFPHLHGLALADPDFHEPHEVDILLGNRYATRIKTGGLIHGPYGTPSAENTEFGWILSGELPKFQVSTSVQAVSAAANMATNAIAQSPHTVVTGSVVPNDASPAALREPTSISHNTVPGDASENHAVVQDASVPITPTLSEVSLKNLVEKFWESDQPESQVATRSIADSKCEAMYLATTTRDATGRYIVRLPFREDSDTRQFQLGDSLTMARRRFYNTERRIHKDDTVRQAYVDYIRNNFAKGILEVVPRSEVDCPAAKSYYMPYKHVVKESSSSTKIRIVFDCSARTNPDGPSLNDVLYPGPKLQVDIMPLLVRYRAYPFVISADIEKFFTQIWIDDSQKDYQRLLYREYPQLPFQQLRFRRVLFGAGPSPYLAIRTLQKLFEDECEDESIRTIIRNDVLVDNVLTGAFSIERAREIQKTLREVMAKGHFPLCKWASNVEELLTDIPLEEREVKKPLFISSADPLPTLGLRWNPVADSFTVVIPTAPNPAVCTKRTVLSNLAKLYDPLGWLSPVSIRAKILLQEIWKAKVDWDEPVPIPIQTKWNRYTSDLQCLKDFTVPRGYFPFYEDDDATASYELSGFSDASNAAHAAVVYLRRITPHEVKVSLVGSKTKVTPTAGETTPRSELNGAKLLAKFAKTIRSALPMKIQSIQCFSDSTSVLGWLNGPPDAVRKREVFVLHRMRAIAQDLPEAKWSFVKGTENPADLPSRGISARELLSNPMWLNGPTWLSTTSGAPPYQFQSKSEVLNATALSSVFHAAAHPTTSNNVPVSSTSKGEAPLSKFIQETSSLPRMKTFVASGRRFLRNATSATKDLTPLSPTELEQAMKILVKNVQQQGFPEEIALLKRGSSPNFKKIKFLAPFLDDNGILRVGGRLTHADVSFDKRHPMLLPKKHHFTEVLIRYLHVKRLHAGPTLLLCILRDQFWIFDGPTTVKRIIRGCVLCFRNKPTPLHQIMGPLPAYRIKPALRCFITTAMDFAGPFILMTAPGRHPRLEKHYFCVFVCAATKAVHIELVGDLSTPGFIAALNRFVSRRGLPRLMISDNGTNFVGAKKDLEELQTILKSEKFQKDVTVYSNESGIEFDLNPPLAPHHGGLFEAAVKSAKFHLHRIVGNQHLTIEEFNTLLTQVEAALNSRPLTPLSSDPAEFQALTPAHFLIGDTLHTVPAEDLTDRKMTYLKRWQRVQCISQHFWNRFTSEYIGTLQSRPKWIAAVPDIKTGVLALVREDNKSFSSTKWNLARVHAVYPGTDGKVRVVDIKTPQGKIFRRSISCIAPLPIDIEPIIEAKP